MVQRPPELLVATGADEFFSEISRVPSQFQFQRCLPHQIDDWLRHYDAGALIYATGKFDESLPAAVRRWKTLRPHVQVLLVFEHPLETRAVVALLRAGAFDVLEAPQGMLAPHCAREILSSLSQRLEQVWRGSLARLQARQSVTHAGLVGESPPMHRLFSELRHAARLNCPVLISGEPGTGKRLMAHAIHALSPRNGKPIISVDCPSVSPALLESELCGGGGPGTLVEAARGGTLLLSEISELPLDLQSQLLRLLESEDQSAPAALDIRLLSTTSRKLEQLLDAKSFRVELYYRLNVLEIEVPPLRQHLQDVPLLARHFASRHARHGSTFVLAEETELAMRRYHWPGNVKELKSAIEYAVTHSGDNTIVAAHLPASITGGPRPLDPDELNLAKLERAAVHRALEAAGSDKTKAARLLGIGKTTLYRKLKAISEDIHSPRSSADLVVM